MAQHAVFQDCINNDAEDCIVLSGFINCIGKYSVLMNHTTNRAVNLDLNSFKYADILNQPRKYSYFKNGGLPIGRCKACYEIHNEGSFTKLSRLFKGAPKPKIRKGDNASIRNHPLVIEKIHEGYEPGLPRS